MYMDIYLCTFSMEIKKTGRLPRQKKEQSKKKDFEMRRKTFNTPLARSSST